MRSRWTAVVGAPLALMVFVAGPARAGAEDCVKTNAVFSPGQWVSTSVEIGGQDDDGLSTINLHGSGSFSLKVTEHGEASGGLSIEGGSGNVMNDATDKSHAETSFVIDAQLSGTGAKVYANGEQNVSMSGEIDVSGGDGKGLSGVKTDELPDFANDFTRPWETTFVPTQANCGQAIGTFGGGQLSYLDDGTLNAGDLGSFWFAHKLGKSKNAEEIEQDFVELMEDAQFVLNMNPIDTDVLSQFILDVFAFDSVLSSAALCDQQDLGSLAPGHPAYAMLQSVMLNTMHTFLNSADQGAYATRDVIDVVTFFLQSAALGWRGTPGECLDVNTSNEGALDLFVKVEDVLIERFQIARDANVEDELAMIAAAAYQFGMPRLIEEVNQ